MAGVAFGSTLLRAAGFALFWVAWACGSQRGYAYCAALLVAGLFAWSGGTSRYARRRGHWPSSISARLLGWLPKRTVEHRRAENLSAAAKPDASPGPIPGGRGEPPRRSSPPRWSSR